MDQIKISKSSPKNKDSPKAQDNTTVVPAHKKDPPLESGHYTNNCGVWNLKHDISLPKLYDLFIKT